MTTQRTRFGHYMPVVSFCLFALSSSSTVYGRGVVRDCAPNAIVPDECPYTWPAEAVFNFSQADSATLALDFPLRIGDDSFTSITLDRNGFVTFEQIAFDPSLAALTDLGVNVIAPFYSAIEFTSTEISIGVGQHYDLPVNPTDPVTPVGPAAAYRFTWGIANGVSMLGGPPDVTNKFQLIVIDRSDVGAGDFDLEMNYGPIEWESPPTPPATATGTLVGLALGATVIDFNRYYDSFLSNGLCEDAGKITIPGSFAVSEPFGCNNITVQFRDGIGTMVGFTSDLGLVAAADSNSINQGEDVVLTFMTDNAGPDATTNATLVVGIPSEVTLVGTDPDDGSCTSDDTQLTCALGAIATSESATVSVTVRVDGAGTLDFPAQVTADQLDPGPSVNASTLSIAAAPSADLNLAASVAPSTVNVGDATELSLTVRNDGPSDASNVHLVATLPAETSIDASANLPGCTATASGLDCALGALATGATTALVVPLNADDSGSLSLVTTIEADEHDPDADDNRTETVLTSNGQSDIGLDTNEVTESVSEGDAVSVTFTVTNAGPQDASEVTLIIALPALLEFTSGEGCSASGMQVTCVQGDLALGESATIELALAATSAGSGTITAEVSAAEEDPAPENNSDAVDLSVAQSDSGGGGGSIDPAVLMSLLLLVWRRAARRARLNGEHGAMASTAPPEHNAQHVGGPIAAQ